MVTEKGWRQRQEQGWSAAEVDGAMALMGAQGWVRVAHSAICAAARSAATYTSTASEALVLPMLLTFTVNANGAASNDDATEAETACVKVV